MIRLGQKGYLDTIEKAIIKGETVLLENIGETVDPVLDPLLGRNLIKKGRYVSSKFLTIYTKEYYFDLVGDFLGLLKSVTKK